MVNVNSFQDTKDLNGTQLYQELFFVKDLVDQHAASDKSRKPLQSVDAKYVLNLIFSKVLYILINFFLILILCINIKGLGKCLSQCSNCIKIASYYCFFSGSS